jgi:hypothetical protein
MGKNVQLTEEIVGRARRGRVLGTLAGMLIVFAVLNFGARGLLDRFTTNRTYWLIQAKWSLVERLERPVDWLILGDSSCNQGVRPDVLRDKLGGSVLNLCTIGDMLAINDAWMLQRAIARGATPKNVVIVHVYDMWQRPAGAKFRETLITKIPLGWGFWEAMRPPMDMSFEQKRAFFLSRYAPLWSENVTLSDWAMNPRKLLSRNFSIDEEGYMRSDLVRPQSVEADYQEHRRFVRGRKFIFSEANRLALEQIRLMADEHDFHVHIASAPLYKGLWNDEEFQAYYRQVQAGLRGVVKRSHRLSYVLEQPPVFEAEQMENADHVNHEAAGVFTERLADALRGAEPAP